MLYPGKKEFDALCTQGNLIPVYREILADLDTPVSAFLKLSGTPSFLLESVEGGEKWARYSFLGSRPSKVFRARERQFTIEERGSGTVMFEADDPLEVLKKELMHYRPVAVKGLPRFFGGMVGYIGYDMVRFFERIPDLRKPGPGLSDLFFLVTDTMLIFDSLKQKIIVLSNVHLDGKTSDEAYREANEKISEIIDKLNQPTPLGARSGPQEEGETPIAGAAPPGSTFISSFGSREAFEQAVVKAKEFVMAGDIVQVVLSQRFDRHSAIDPFHIYRALRVINPSPYMYYLDTGEAKIAGSSPEILVRCEGDEIVLRPIAGTRRRGKTDQEDNALEEELRKDPKEVAEHIMLVDLGRNDVGRIAEVGSVKVTELMTVERYSHVMHLVSNVRGSLREGLDAFDVLRATFPAGTVSGAPKVRAMEIIEELEPLRRGPYAGAVGYISFTGNMDTCITIRTIVASDGKISVQAGAGIVADSDPEREYRETVNKATAMMKAVDMAEQGLE